MSKEEKKNKLKGILTTIGIHILLLLLFIFLGFKTPFPPPAEEGILINFGTAETGSGEIQPEQINEDIVEPIEEVTTEATDAVEEVIEQEVEEAPAIEQKKEIKKETETPKEQEEPKEPTIDDRFILKGNRNNDATSQGDNGTQGDQGTKTGDLNGINGNGEGLGNSGIGFDLSGRSMLLKPNIKDNSQETGKVVVKIKVDRTGKVIYAKYSLKGSTTNSAHLIKLAEEAAYSAKFNGDRNAAEEQFGSISFTFKVQ